MSKDDFFAPGKKSKDGALDLRMGDPLYLSEYWKKKKLKLPSWGGPGYRKNIEPELESLLRVMGYVQNLRPQGRYHSVVLGNGSSQLIQAAAYAFRMKTGHNVLYAPAPYWPRFDQIVELAGSQMHDLKSVSLGVPKLVTNPNNPCGSFTRRIMSQIPGVPTIFDLNYNWPHYRKSEILHSDFFTADDVFIYGMSKLSGHASLRVGWAYVADPTIAKFMVDFIEASTCGVSMEAQKKAYSILNHIDNHPEYFRWARNKLDRRFIEVSKYLEPDNTTTMFFYGKGKVLADKAGVLYIPSQNFKDAPGKIRLNLGCSDSDFKELIRRLAAAKRKKK